MYLERNLRNEEVWMQKPQGQYERRTYFKKLNRMLALLVMLMMALSMFTFASAEESKTVTFPLEEPIEVTVYCCAGESSYKLEDTAIYKWMEEKTNVHLKVVNTNLTENDEKRNIALNSGDYAEVFFKSGVSPDQLLEFGKEGVFIALDDMLREYAPQLLRHH